MLAMAAPGRAVHLQRMPPAALRADPTDEAVAIGRAIQSVRKAKGVSQEELAARLGVERQTVSRYETGRSAVLRTDVQRSIAEALGVTVAQLMDEIDNIVRPDFPLHGLATDAPVPPRTVVAVQAQPEIGDDGRLHYVEVPPLSSEDLGWLFGPNAGFLRLADGALPDGPFSARVAGFDRSVWPRRGQGCVIETRDGEMLPCIYERRTEAGVLVRRAEGDHTVPSLKVKGVYAIRYWGD